MVLLQVTESLKPFFALWTTCVCHPYLLDDRLHRSIKGCLVYFEEVEGAYCFWVVRPFIHPYVRLSVHHTFWYMPYLMNCACWGFEISYIDSSWKNSWYVFFFLSKLCPFWSYAPLKKLEWNLVSKLSQKWLDTWSADRGWWVDYLINFWTNYIFSELWSFENVGILNCQQDFSKTIWARGLKFGHLVGEMSRLSD